MHRRVVSRVRKNIPGAKNKIVEAGERHKILDRRHPIIGALSQANRAHLRQAADWFSETFFDCFNTRDKSRAHCSQTDEQHAQLAFGRRDLRALLDRHYVQLPP